MPTRPLGIVGNLNVDLWVRTVERFPRWDEEVVVDSARLELAGTAGYLMLACAGLGVPTYVVSTIGDDAFGRFLLGEIARLGLDPSGLEVLPGQETSLGMAFVGDRGQRGLLSTLGAHKDMSLEVVERHDDALAQCEEVFLCGSYLLPRLGPREVLGYARRARERGQVVAFDPSWDPSGWTGETRDATYALLREVDVYLPNDEELTHLTGAGSWEDALAEVQGLAGETVVKLGPQGAVWASGGERVMVDALPVQAINTIGAGDVFDAGYLYARRQGWEPRHRLEFANALAGIVVSQPGERRYPSAEEVLAFLGDYQ